MIAALIRDHQGEVKGSTFVKIEAVLPLEGEATAAKLGVEFATQMGFRDIILEGDSALLIMAIQKWPQRTDWRIHSTISEIVGACNQMVNWTAVHVVRGGNEAVHHFARWVATEFISIAAPVVVSIFLSYLGCMPRRTHPNAL